MSISNVLLSLIKSQRLNPDFVVDYNFKKQADFVLDSSPFISGFCTRRAGKSYGVAIRLVRDAMSTPGCNVLYLALTRDSAKNILWKDCLKDVLNRNKIPYKPNETALTCTLENGSIIKLSGADATKEEMDKLLGGKYKTCLIDEAGSFRQDLRNLVYGKLKPAVADHNGSIILVGTPADLAAGLFYDVTTNREKGWVIHKWNTFDNPYMADKWKSEIEQLTSINPLIKETPLYKRNYLGEWFIDNEKLVYRYSEDKNIEDKEEQVKAEINRLGQSWRYVLGVDLGYHPDPSAFVLVAYNEFKKQTWIIEASQKEKMDLTDVSNKIKEYLKIYPFLTVVIDAAGKQGVEEMKHRHNVPLKYAEKHDKATFIELLNADLIQGNIRVMRNAISLCNEWNNLIWDDRSTKRIEHPNCPNHMSDAFLYAWRHTYAYLHTNEPKDPHPNTDEWADAFWEKEIEQRQINKSVYSEEVQPIWERQF